MGLDWLPAPACLLAYLTTDHQYGFDNYPAYGYIYHLIQGYRTVGQSQRSHDDTNSVVPKQKLNKPVLQRL